MSEYVAKGSYGCVIKPNINCDGTFGNENQITKFFFNERDYEFEKKTQSIIEEIDKDKKFTIKMIYSCKINITDEIKQQIKDFKSCDIKNNEIFQITYENGGIDIYNIFKKKKDELNKLNLFKLLQKFVNIFEGLCVINENNLVHFDIRIDNLLYDINKDKFVIIDFGLIKEKSNAYSTNNLLNKPHPSYPNDINILYSYINGNNYNYLNNYELNSNIFIELISYNINKIKIKYEHIQILYFKKVLNKILDINKYLSIDIFKKFDINFWINIFEYKNYSKDFSEKLDVYMLGLTLFEFILQIFQNLDNKTINKIPLKLFSLIKKMISINPYERPTIQEATKEFKSIMKIK
jgi:serine/threonine protein kinase